MADPTLDTLYEPALAAGLRVVPRDHVLEMSFTRVAKRNAFGTDTYVALAQAYGLLQRGGWRVGLLYGEGEHFTAGLDLPQWSPVLKQGRLADLPPDALEPFGLDPLRRLTKPMVVAAEGVSFTVAMELMLAAEIRVASRSARFAQLEVLRGFFPCGGATVRLMQEVGYGHAMRIILGAVEIDGAEAHRIGFVQELTEVGAALAAARTLADRVAVQAPLGVCAALASARQAREHGEAAAIAALMPALIPLLQSADAAEALLAFQERRTPLFRGN